ncbi:Diguanylate cyclase/phosphodiesterase with PAS/PAC sensor(S) [Burkholderiales bacterium]|nr:Diguanylate cyclase/phosphodiesterase with PAS/PAC sensor(S) [Burkholderiales bacterium]
MDGSTSGSRIATVDGRGFPASANGTFSDIDAAGDIEAQAQRKKTALLYGNAGIALAVTLVNASLLAYVNRTLLAAASVAVLWWCLIVTIAAGRYLLARRFVAAKPDAPAAMAWRRRYIGGTAMVAAAWGAGAFLFVWNAPEGGRLFTGLVTAGMVAGAVPMLAPVPAAFRAFTLLAIVPFSTVILLQADSALDWAYGSMTIVFLAAVLVSARYLHKTLDVSIRLGLEQRRLAANLERARDTAETALAERKRAEETLQASEERYRLILQHSPTGILHYDNDLVVSYCNDRLAQIIQVPRERLIGFDMNTLKDQRVLPALQAATKGEQGTYDGEYASTQSGVHVWVTMSCTPFRGVQGQGEGGIAIVEDVTDRRRSEDEIRNLAYFDPLTRLPNRRLLIDRLGHAMTASNRSAEFGALMILDLDHFKSINDTQGHDVGDRLLVEVAQRLVVCLRQDDTVSRLGGDEYVVLLEGLGQAERSAAAKAESIAEKMRAAINQPYVLGGSEAEYFSTTSIGLTLFCGHDHSAEVLLKQADVAMYQAKSAGRNTVRFFSPAMQASIEIRTALEAALRRGLDKGEFRLYYQPQVDQDGRLTGAEALIRWLPPDQGMVSPAQFIPLAEESGLILPIGQWVLDTACNQLKAWERNPHTRGLRLSVNVSARQFHQPDFVEQVSQSLLASGADPGRLELELTEGVVLDHVDSVINRMRQLIALGVGFSLDDFGTGYSSLSYLKRLPLDQVKIDQSFVRDVPGDPNDVAIVRAILAMSQTLGLQVIAEGVETQEQRDFLARNGCNAYQGYLFSRPLPIEDFEQFVARREHGSVRLVSV